MKKLFSLLILVLALAAGAYVALPFVTLMQINSAIEARDSARLSRHVDFPRLRANLKQQLRGPAGDWLYRQGKDDVEGFFASLVGGFMTGSTVDAMVSPQGLSVLMKGQTSISQIKGETGGSSSNNNDQKAKKSFRFASPSEFHLVLNRQDQPPVTIVLTRRGFQWKLSNILLPMSEGK